MRRRPLLVWCRICTRYISREHAHECALDLNYRRARTAARDQPDHTKGAA